MIFYILFFWIVKTRKYIIYSFCVINFIFNFIFSNGYIHTEPHRVLNSRDHQCKSNNADVSVFTTNLDDESPFSIITKMTRSPIRCSHDASTSGHDIFSRNYASYVQLLHRFSSRDAILDTRSMRSLCEPLAGDTLSFSKAINRKSKKKGFVTGPKTYSLLYIYKYVYMNFSLC